MRLSGHLSPVQQLPEARSLTPDRGAGRRYSEKRRISPGVYERQGPQAVLLTMVPGGSAIWVPVQDGASVSRTTWPSMKVIGRSTGREGRVQLPKLNVAEIAQIHIKHKKDELNIVLQDGVWRVKERAGFPAGTESAWKVEEREELLHHPR